MTEQVSGGRITRQGQGERFLFLGELVEVLVSEEATGGAYSLAEFTFPPGSGAPPHVHAHEDEIFHVLEGELEFHLGDAVVRAKAGDTVHALRGHKHFFVNATDCTARMQVGIVPGGFMNFFRSMGSPVGETPPPPDIPGLVAAAEKYGCTIFAQEN